MRTCRSGTRPESFPFSAQRSTRIALLLSCAAALALLAGCKLLAAPFLLWGEEPTKKVEAKYPYLDNKKICVLVWAEQGTLFEYPNVRYELAEFLGQELKSALKGVTLTSNQTVVEFENREYDWERMNPASIGARFKAERVLMVELTEYTTREPDSPHLYRGHISANIKIYDTSQPDAGPTYRTQVATVYPPNTMSEWGADDRVVRRDTMQQFAADVVNNFHDRQEKK